MGLWHGKVAEAGYARMRRTLAQVELTPHGDTPPLIDPATGVLGRRTPGWLAGLELLAGRRTPGWLAGRRTPGWLAGWLAGRRTPGWLVGRRTVIAGWLAVELLAGWLAGI